jgi:hypothetical protein
MFRPSKKKGYFINSNGEEVSEYEKNRLENMAKNAAYMKEIGLDAVVDDLAIENQPKPSNRGLQKRKKSIDGPRRKSTRLAGEAASGLYIEHGISLFFVVDV